MVIHRSPERSIAGAVGPMWSWPIKSIPDHSALESLTIKSLIIKSLTIKSTPGHSTLEFLTGKSDIGDDEDDGDEGDDYSRDCGGDDFENEFERVLKGRRITYIGKPWHLGESRVNRVNKVGGVAVGHLLKQTRSHKATCSAQMDQLEHSSKITIFPRSSSSHNSTFWVQWRSRWTRT